MKFIKALLAISACFVVVQTTTAQKLAAKKQVLQTITLANKYFMDKWPDAAKPIFVPSRSRTWPSHIWTRAVYYEGLMALYSVDKQKAYYNYAFDWSAKHNWSLRDGIKTRNGDNQACGQTYIDLYLIDKDKSHIDSIKASIDLMMQSQNNQ
jgi:unsaturated rhamnogalacturonyl hydrolase